MGNSSSAVPTTLQFSLTIEAFIHNVTTSVAVTPAPADRDVVQQASLAKPPVLPAAFYLAATGNTPRECPSHNTK